MGEGWVGARDKREERDSRDVRALFLPVALFRQSRQSRLSQALVITAETFLTNAG